MANIKSAQKRARQEVVRRQRNNARKTALKTAIKKVVVALEDGNKENVQLLFQEAVAKIARARGKGLLHKNTAARKMSRLARRIVAAQK